MKKAARPLRRGVVLNQGVVVGVLEETAQGYRFTYDPAYLALPGARPVSLTLPPTPRPYESRHLFPFFYGLLAEGSTRQMQARRLRLDDEDYFGLLLATAGSDVIGSVTVRPADEDAP